MLPQGRGSCGRLSNAPLLSGPVAGGARPAPLGRRWGLVPSPACQLASRYGLEEQVLQQPSLPEPPHQVNMGEAESQSWDQTEKAGTQGSPGEPPDLWLLPGLPSFPVTTLPGLQHDPPSTAVDLLGTPTCKWSTNPPSLPNIRAQTPAPWPRDS